MIRFLFTLVVVCGLIFAGVGFFVVKSLSAIDGPLESDAIVYITGTSVEGIGRQMADINAVDAVWIFRASALLHRAGGPLQAGEYLIEDGMSTDDIVTLLQSGKTYARVITVPEGLMSVEIVALINAAEGLEGEIAETPAEGTLLPETYHYRRGDSRAAVIARMQASMQDTLQKLWAARSADTPVATPEDAVILASIVEKETGVAAERPKVAGVFANRLRANMPLQSDPTVIYAITQGKERLDRQLYRKDLAVASPYNTYANAGLPPGPIANPGALSLQAVLAPEQHDYVYFVADGTGGHAFGKTLAEHNANVAKWRQHAKMLRNQPASTPSP